MSGLGTSIVAAFLLVGVSGVARGNPCVLEYVAGRNLLAATGQGDVFIAREEIRFEVRTHREWVKYPNARLREPVLEGEVTISYQLDNRGPAKKVVVGFPIGLYNDDISPFRNIVSRFRVKGAGAGSLLSSGEAGGISLDRAVLDRCERENAAPGQLAAAGAPPPPPYAWYVWPQSFSPGLNKLEVRYHLKALSAEAGDDARLTIGYVLKTTVGWGDGKIGHLEILFSEKGAAGRWEVRRGPKEPPVVQKPGLLRWRLESFTPEDDLSLSFTSRADLDE